MAELTIEQQRALALAAARKRAAEAGGSDYQQPPMPPGMVLDPKTGQVIDTRQEAEINRRAGGFMQKASDAAGQFVAGTPFVGEYLDEAYGKLSGLFGGNEELATERARAKLKSFEEANPKTSLALRIGGGISGSLPMAAAAAPRLAGSAMSLGAKMLAGAGIGGVTGGVEGAVSGYGAGTDPESRMQSAKTRGAVGGTLGMVVGAAVPAIAAAARPVVQRITDALSVGKRATEQGLSRPSYRAVTRAMDADGSLGGAGAANIARAGPDAMLADAGPNARSLLDTSIQRSGPAGTVAREAIEGRAAAANRQIAQSLDDVLGKPQGVRTVARGIRQGSAPARAAAYDTAYSRPIDYADPRAFELERLLRRVPGDVVKRANRLMALEGEQSRQIMAQVADDGAVVFKTMPDVRQLDYITRALNDVAEAGEEAGKLGGQTAIGRAYQNLSRDIRDVTRQLVPEYGSALDTAAEPIAARQALLAGQKLLSRTVTRDEAAEAIGGMTRAERLQAMQGLRSNLDDMLANVQRAISDGNMDAREAVKAVKELSSRASREKVALLVGRDQADRLFSDLDRATMALDLRAGVATNSRTYARLAMDDAVKETTEPGAIGTLLEGKPLNATKRAIQALTGRTPEAKRAAGDQVYEEIVRALTGPRGLSAQQALQDLRFIGSRSARNEEIARALAARGALSLGLPAYQTGTQLTRGR